MPIRSINCSYCQKVIGYNYLESVWEENDENTYKLIHPICGDCWLNKFTEAIPQTTGDKGN